MGGCVDGREDGLNNWMTGSHLGWPGGQTGVEGMILQLAVCLCIAVNYNGWWCWL